MKLESDDDAGAVGRNVMRWFKYSRYHAAPSPEGSVVNQDMSPMPNVMPSGPAVKRPLTSVCAECGVVIPPLGPCRDLNDVQCDQCGLHYHWRCANLFRPPRHGSWMCHSCRMP